MTRSAAFFDLDKTIIARSSSLAFSRPFYASGLINRRTVLRSGYAQFVYLAGGADHDQMERMRQYLQSMVTGWPVAQVRDVVAECPRPPRRLCVASSSAASPLASAPSSPTLSGRRRWVARSCSWPPLRVS